MNLSIVNYMKTKSGYFYQQKVKEGNREEILNLLKDEPKRFTDLLNQSGFSPRGLTGILKDLEDTKKIQRTVNGKKQAYEITKSGVKILTGHYLLRSAIKGLEERGSEYYEDRSNLKLGILFCRLPWGIDEDLIVQNTIGEKFNPITKDVAASLNETLYKKIREKIIKKEIPVDKTRKGAIFLSFYIDYAELIESIEQNSLEYEKTITKRELDILQKMEYGTVTGNEIDEIKEIRMKKSKGKTRVSGLKYDTDSNF